MNKFYQDVLRGLQSSPKYLESKYFYDETGDQLFQQIMASPEYYLTKCELEIFSAQSQNLVSAITKELKEFDIVELGAGDALKSSYLLKSLLGNNIPFTYLPIDISENVISMLENKLPHVLPGLRVKGFNGEYFDMLKKVNAYSKKNKVLLFLGSNIGNIPLEETEDFFRLLKENLRTGDMILTGFDLKKCPEIILDAYHDKRGITRQFNLNLLQRINNELGADFNLEQFDHYPVYDPESGACKSFLLSLQDQCVQLDGHAVRFKEYESIFTEISQKYTVEQTENIAQQTGFIVVKNFFDSRKWFLDTLWKCC